ncbi:MAG: ATP-binding protein [Verrucomicrobiaceae bacterium]|nr:MAG: ATP-binding protein [Verrucomicrobiaceae bacterium]
MLTSITVENFRGIERLHVEGLGRVNLIIGRNDSGKTALMEALLLATNPGTAGSSLVSRQAERNPDADIRDFDEFWLPIFRRMDATRGFSIEFARSNGPKARLSIKQAPPDSPVAPEGLGIQQVQTGAWALVREITKGDETITGLIQPGTQGIRFPSSLNLEAPGWNWVSSASRIGALEIRELSKLKQQNKDNTIINLLQYVNNQITSIELLALTGKHVNIYIRLKNEGLIPILMMGEGMKRYFEFAVVLASAKHKPIYIDEIENGLHHSTLEPLWNWIAMASDKQDVQIFVTTHSEECVQAASRAFNAQNDDGLRVIRLDKQEHETKAVVYDRDLVEAAERMGVEIRG